jgi:hypothetical protein
MWPIVAMTWALCGVVAATFSAAWWVLVLWLGPLAYVAVRCCWWTLVELGVIEVGSRLWSDEERERHEREAGL